MKKLALFLFLFFISLPVFAQNITIAVVSDVNLSVDKKENKMTPSIQKLLNFTGQANQYGADYVVFLGDNLKSADRISLAMFSKIINKLKSPYFVTVGNNDLSKTKEITHKEYYRILNKFSSNQIKKLPSYKKTDDLVFIFLSGANETFATYNGYYKA
ncbi:MAG: metallophosphoesterase, partial [Candidatus Gastranaerophilales bacterium]|nr:metallophosphoesterase [Candidatus Gastranaerophilales bacterium]